MGSNPARVVMKTPFEIKATGSHLLKLNSLERKLGALLLVSATLEIKYATQFSTSYFTRP